MSYTAYMKAASLSQSAAEYQANLIGRALDDDQAVVWLLSGGSAIQVAVLTAKALQRHDVSRLTVSLTDERYGPVGHANSNWQQLMEAGFSLPEAIILPVLTGAGLAETAMSWGGQLQAAIDDADLSIGLFGIGPDGHTAGILPGSPAVTATGPAAYYITPTHQRITTTFNTIAILDEAVVYAVGEAKWPTMAQFETTVSRNQQPAQVLKAVKHLHLFTDYKGAHA